MHYGKVEICGVNTSELRVLTDEEKMEYLRRARAGDEYAREELICGNLRLVLSVIQRFCGRKEPMDDIFIPWLSSARLQSLTSFSVRTETFLPFTPLISRYPISAELR